MSRDVAERLAPVVKLIAEFSVGLLEAGKDAGQAHNVGDVTPYANSLFYFVAHDFRFMDLLLKSEEFATASLTVRLSLP